MFYKNSFNMLFLKFMIKSKVINKKLGKKNLKIILLSIILTFSYITLFIPPNLCFNGLLGILAWSYDFGDTIISSPALGDINNDGVIEVVVDLYNGKICAINGKNGTIEWTYTMGG